MATIYTRAGKGSALTWTEGDANITNLNTAKLENVVEDTTPQLGGNLDVNGNSIVSTSNANIVIEPNGTGDVQLNADLVRVGDSNANATITTNGTGDLILSTNSGSNSGVITIQDGLDNDITFVPAGTGKVHFETSETRIGINNTNAKITTKGTGDLTLDTHSGTNSGSIVIADGVNGNISVTPNGTGKISLDGLLWPNADGTNGQVLQTNGSGTLSFTTVSAGATTLDGLSDVVITAAATDELLQYNGTNWVDTAASAVTVGKATNLVGGNSTTLKGSIPYQSDTNTTSLLSPNVTTTNKFLTQVGDGTNGFAPLWQAITGLNNVTIGSAVATTGNFTSLGFTNAREPIYDIGTSGGTIAPDAANGSVQKITLNSALTLNAFTSPVAGQSLTLLIYGGTAYTSITSTMKFAGGIKTLTATAGCIDIVSIYYDGTTYFASLGKGFA